MGIDYLQGYYLGKPDYTPQPISPDVAAEIRTMAAKRQAKK